MLAERAPSEGPRPSAQLKIDQAAVEESRTSKLGRIIKKGPIPFGSEPFTLDLAMFPLPFSKVKSLYRVSEKVGPGKTTSASFKGH